MSAEEIHTIDDFIDNFREVLSDLYAIKNMYDDWRGRKRFISARYHVDVDVVDAAPAAGELKAEEVVMGDATGPNGRDELFWSVDGETVARVEADAIIT